MKKPRIYRLYEYWILEGSKAATVYYCDSFATAVRQFGLDRSAYEN